jgi:fission 1 protein
MSAEPYAIEAEVALLPSDLTALRQAYSSQLPTPTAQAKFAYAWGLIRSQERENQEVGLRLMASLLSNNDFEREATFYCALGNYKLGNYAAARKHLTELLKSEPNNRQAQSLLALIDERVKQEGLIGLGLVGAGIALAAVFVGSLARSR